MNLHYFEPSEFNGWLDKICPTLLVRLDILRFQLDRPVIISPNPQAVGRHSGALSKSEHNIDYWGKVLAVDCFVAGVYSRDQVEHVVEVATRLGFTGIGVYPKWINPAGIYQPGFHFGTRPTRKMGDPATWGYITEFISLNDALAEIKQLPM